MGFNALDISDFIRNFRQGNHVLLDARSESEFAHAHIPGAINIPILNDEERKQVGTEYKQNGRERAILLGFRLVGPRFHQIIAETASQSESNQLLIYCWRGGMRSQILAWLLSLYGFRIQLLKGGYKAFRNHALEICSQHKNFLVVGGATGSGKTELLSLLANHGEQVLDLESLAIHRGSAFGGIGLPPQPSNEYFENQIAMALMAMVPEKVIWIENESRTIGRCAIPNALFETIRQSRVIELNVPTETRKERITKEYGKFPFPDLADASNKIKKRIGPQNLKLALEHLENGDFESWLTIIMEYYDKLYAHSNSLRDRGLIHRIETDFSDPEQLVQTLIGVKYKLGYD